MKYLVLILVLVVVLGGGGYALYSRVAASGTTTAPVQTDVVTRRDLERTVIANGKVASNRDVDIKCKASGSIIELPFDVSDDVAPGAVLLRLDTVDQDRLIESAKATVDADQARVREAELNWKIAQMNIQTTETRVNAALVSAKAKANDSNSKALRTKELFDSKLASKEDLETAQTSAAQAEAEVQNSEAAVAELNQQKLEIDTKEQQKKQSEAQLQQDQAKLETAETNKTYCTVTAPDIEKGKENDPPKWRVASIGLNVQIGYLVQSGTGGSSGGTTVMTLSDLSHVFILANVDESNLGQISDPSHGGERAKVRVKVDAYSGTIFEGEVVRIGKGTNSSNVVTFEVKIEITSANRNLLRPEMTAEVNIITASKQDVLTFPIAAFTKTPMDRSMTRPTTTAATTDTSTEPADATATAPGARRGRGRGGRSGRNSGVPSGRPIDGTVQVVKPDGSTEIRNVTVGLADEAYYEVLQGLQEGETVALNGAGSDSRWKNSINGNPLPRGMGGGGGRGR